tara:strand:+ start:45 stop:1253 length:1209 start_codon:yes stop_codon:yes gene_type:complete
VSNIIIIGAGQAAGQCVATLKKLGCTNKIILIGEESHPPYQRPPLSKSFLEGKVGLERVYMKNREFYEENGVEFYPNTLVKEIDREEKRVRTSCGKEFEFEKLVIATGSRARELEIEGIQLGNVYYLRTIDDVEKIKEQMSVCQNLSIIGAGYIGLEVAAVASELGMNVSIFEMADRSMNRTVDKKISEHFEDLHKTNGVNFYFQSNIEELQGETFIEGVKLDDGSLIPADILIIGIGIIPNQELAENAGLDCNNGILVNDKGITSDQSIFACGDCTNHPNKFLNKNVRLESVQNALEQSKVVAANIMGQEEKYEVIPWFWSDQYNQKLQIVGMPEEYDEIVKREYADGFSLFYLSNKTIISVTTINNPKEFLICKKLVEKKVKISSDILTKTANDLNELVK